MPSLQQMSAIGGRLEGSRTQQSLISPASTGWSCTYCGSSGLSPLRIRKMHVVSLLVCLKGSASEKI